jgi:redox-sensitive bicupin YhaK (pirin superfamily)
VEDVEVRRAGERFRTASEWLESRHSFSFGEHFDPGNTGFGLLVVSNDDIVAPGTGFDTHPHRDMEIVTWVLSGSLVHSDSDGNSGVIHPGLAQRMSAGTGILHSERNDSWRLTGKPAHTEPVHFVQMWVLPDEPGLAPSYQQQDVSPDLATGALVPIASGHTDAAVHLNQRDATLYAARVLPGGTVSLPPAPYLHVFIARGQATLGATELGPGDAARLRDTNGPRLTAGPDGAEVLAWEFVAGR